MDTTTIPTVHDLQVVVENLAKGIRDPEVARKARERMDLEREELRKRIGTTDVAVDLVRDARDQ